MRRHLLLTITGILLLSMATILQGRPGEEQRPFAADIHSYANPAQARVTHLDLDLTVLFDEKILKGTALLSIERSELEKEQQLVLDTKKLEITKAEASPDGKNFTPAAFTLGQTDAILGTPLMIELPPGATMVRVTYATSPEATALQWLAPAQTAGKKSPFLFTQSQAINARSWIPLQDSPQLRLTYTARIHTPMDLLAVMSAENDTTAKRTGDYSFAMPQAVPSYLIALAVGDLEFRPLGPRTGVYAEPPVVERAADEFVDVEKMVSAIEKLYGPYRWGRYDLLVLPPSFPFGGMENPRLTFATPTILAGDRSLVSLVAHELAHSWSGNLVSNATWSDFWLNEGFTVYVERRAQEEVYGRSRSEMEAMLGRRGLIDNMATLDDKDEILYIDLSGRDPDDGVSDVPYEKGYLFLRLLEETFGRETFDTFLRSYFDHFAFQSITTADFTAYLKEHLFAGNAERAARIPLDEWLYQPGLPAGAPDAASEAFVKVEAEAQRWVKGSVPASQLNTTAWTTQEWLHFLQSLPKELDVARMTELDEAFHFTKSGNSEIACEWLQIAIRNRYAEAYPRLEEYLTTIGRRKLVKPLYVEMMKSPEGREMALGLYKKARPGYHAVTTRTIDGIVK